MNQYILSLSYGKDSLACIEACHRLGQRIDRIIHAEVWATDTIPADLPPMVEFKKKADKIIKERYGLEVEHICATRGGYNSHTKSISTQSQAREKTSNSLISVSASQCNEEVGARSSNTELGSKLTYEKIFYRHNKVKNQIYGFPIMKGNWCTSELKKATIPNEIQILGIAADEPERIERHTKPNIILPLVQIGWTEADCRKWCEENDLLSPIYKDSLRGGCWFCHNQGVGQLRLLRKNYPDLWELLMKWDNDSPVTFHADGHTVRDFDKRFALEDEGLIKPNEQFRWDMLKYTQLRLDV